MNSTVSKSNLEGTSPLDRLHQIRMGAHDRLIAEAHLARAEVFADLLIGVVTFANRGLRALVVRPFQRVATAFS